MNESVGGATSPAELGNYLRSARGSLGLSLRAVESRTGITNGYLSQIENGLIAKPSPNVLFDLAELYGLSYPELLVRTGHRVPGGEARGGGEILNGIPLRALEELTSDERKELLSYLSYLRSKR